MATEYWQTNGWLHFYRSCEIASFSNHRVQTNTLLYTILTDCCNPLKLLLYVFGIVCTDSADTGRLHSPFFTTTERSPRIFYLPLFTPPAAATDSFPARSTSTTIEQSLFSFHQYIKKQQKKTIIQTNKGSNNYFTSQNAFEQQQQYYN